MPSEIANPASRHSEETRLPHPLGWLRRLTVPSVSDVLFGAVLIWLFATGEGWLALLGDGDTGYHIRTGDYILANGHVPTVDLFSYTKANEPWFAWEWLSAILFSMLHTAFGLKGVVFYSGVLISAAVAALYRYTIYRGADAICALLFVLLAAGASSIHHLARPHLVTFLFLVITAYLIEQDRRRPGRRIWLLVPVACLWANLHGGFVAMFTIVGLIGLGSLAEGLWETGFDLRRILSPADGPAAEKFLRFWKLAFVGVASLAATLANPYGYQLHTHIVRYLGDSWITRHVQEFGAPQFRTEQERQFEILLFLGLILAAALFRQKRFGEAFLILFWAHQSLGSVRHVTIFVFLATPLIAAEISTAWRRLAAGQSPRSVAGILRDIARDLSAIPLHTSAWGVVLLAVLWVMPGQKWPSDFPSKVFPIKMIDKYAARLNPPAGPKPRILSSDEFGDYLIYRFYPDVRVFMDGRSDFYGPQFGDDYLALLGAGWRWRQLMDKWNFDYALLPHSWGLAEMLKTDPKWRILEDSSAAVLFERRRP